MAHNRDRIRVDDSKLKINTLAVIAAISEEHGLIDYVVQPKAINTEVFVALPQNPASLMKEWLIISDLSY